MKVNRVPFENALQIIRDIIKARKTWGKKASPPYTQDQLYDALIVLEEEGRFEAPSDEDMTKLRRQLAACENREKGRKLNEVQASRTLTLKQISENT